MSDTQTIRAITCRTVDVPYARPVRTASGTMTSASLVLLDLDTADGVTGRSYVRCYTPLVLGPVAEVIRGLAPRLTGQPLAPRPLWASLRSQFRLLGTEGVVGLAINAVDMAAWDALARGTGKSLAALLGAETNTVPAYASLRATTGARLAEEAQEAVAQKFRALKVKVGGRPLAEDYRVLSSLRDLLGNDIDLMCDYNQSLALSDAQKHINALEPLGLRWVEEPLPAGDLDGYRRLTRSTRTAIQAGESWWSPEEAHQNIKQAASDLVMLDVARIGGVTGWLRAAETAASAGLRISSHTYPEFSVQLLAAAANADLLEWLDAAGPINLTPVEVLDGAAIVPDRPGAGIEWDEAMIEKHLVQ